MCFWDLSYSLFFWFFLFRPAVFGFSPFFGPASCFLAFSRGASGPRAFLGFSWKLRGLSSLAPGPSEALFFGREAAWVFLCFWCLVVVFPLLFCFAASHVVLEGPPTARPTAGPGALDVPPLAQVRARGCPLRAEGCAPSFPGFLLPYFVFLAEGHTDPRTHSVRGLFVKEGAFYLPPSGPFFHVLFLPQVIFWPSGPALAVESWICHTC